MPNSSAPLAPSGEITTATNNEDRLCFHCGLEASDSSIRTQVNDDTHFFCCLGCKAIFELISAGGLEDYYTHRTEFGNKPEDGAKHFAEFDNPVFQKRFCTPTERDPKIIQARIYIEGIHCAACVWLLEKRLAHEPGLLSVDIGLVDSSGLLEWDADTIQLSQIVNQIHALGFKVSPWAHDQHTQTQERIEQQLLRKVGLAGIVMMQVGMFSIGLYASEGHGIESEYRNLLHWFSALLSTTVLLYSAQPFFIGAWRSLKSFTVNMDVPVSIALLVAWLASISATISAKGDVYFDSICMFVFLLLGVRYLDLKARKRLTQVNNQGALGNTYKRVDSVQSSHYDYIDIHEVVAGHILCIHRGEVIPIDGQLLSETALLNESSISGEFLPQEKTKGDTLLSGSINSGDTLFILAEKLAHESCLQSIEKLAFEARKTQSYFIKLSDKIARFFSLSVIIVTAIAASAWYVIDASRVLDIAISMLVISCPCALSLATPSALTVATNFLRKHGVLICEGNTLEKLTALSHIAFDKTGTLSKGKFSIGQAHYFNDDPKLALQLAAQLERWSEHPIAKAFEMEDNTATHSLSLSDVQSHSGAGVSGCYTTKNTRQPVRIGHAQFCAHLCSAPLPALANPTAHTGTYIWLVDENAWLACFELHDPLRADAKDAISKLHAYDNMILSGDEHAAVAQAANSLGIETFYARCKPEDKVTHLQDVQDKCETCVMVVGDGINDLPVLAKADVSVAMNSANQLAQTQADCVLLTNDLAALPLLIQHAKSTYRVIRQNIRWALVYNFGALPMAALGMVPPWVAALGMSTSSLVVILNASRLHKQLD